VSAATPVLDTRRQGNVANFDHVMLNEVPTARDPWALMQHLPGVIINRPNVGGSQSATQAVVIARGDDGTGTSWNIDGVTITDPVAPGASSTYFDFNAFEEVQFTTSSVDARSRPAGSLSTLSPSAAPMPGMGWRAFTSPTTIPSRRICRQRSRRKG
jgi:hypothetical protein